MGIENPKIGLGFPSRARFFGPCCIKIIQTHANTDFKVDKKSTRVGGGSDTGYLVVCKYTHGRYATDLNYYCSYTFLPSGGHVRLEG